MATDHKDYILGTSDEEIQRLEFQHQVWIDPVLPLWEDAGFGVGQDILDLGCGPGFASLDLSQLVGPEGNILAVDVSGKYIQYLDERIEDLGRKSPISC